MKLTNQQIDAIARKIVSDSLTERDKELNILKKDKKITSKAKSYHKHLHMLPAFIRAEFVDIEIHH